MTEPSQKRAVYREKPERRPSCPGVVDIILPIKNDCLPCEQEETTFKKWEKDRRGLRQPFSPVQNEQRKSAGPLPHASFAVASIRKCVLSPGPAGLEKAWDGAL